MNRKRDDYEECHSQEGNRLEPILKRIKSPLPVTDQAIFIDENISMNKNPLTCTNMIEQNDHTKLTQISNFSAQSSYEVCHSRKRRPRASKDLFESDKSTTDPSVPCAITSTNGSTRKKSDLSCVVCCGLAHGYNFDAISCESCKAFFRRNALLNTDRLKCRRDDCCDITLETRRRCKSCRLKKCFDVGMRKEWILTEEEKLNKKRRIEENRRLRMEPPDETISSKEKPISNGNRNPSLQSVILEKNSIQPLSSTVGTEDSSLHNQNNDVINNVVKAFNAGFKLDPSTSGWSYPLAKKVTALCQILNTKSITALRLISFYKGLPEFDALNDSDKVNLIKMNLPYIFILHGSLGYDPVKDVYSEGYPPNETLLYGTDIREAHGDNIYFRCRSIMRSLHSIVQIDQRIMQLTLIIVLFSKGLSDLVNFNEPPLNNCQQVLHAQNFYVEQLWLFMEKNYGPMRAVLLFSTLINKCLHTQELLWNIQHDIYEKVDPCQVPPIIRTLMHVSH
ncbi:hypothetical protein I4U23_021042 [Adineta vaga]|nr:hypothetical protein I4U23_021042 [Adineta vaga]